MASYSTCVVLFTYEETPTIQQILPQVLQGKVDRVIVACEGNRSVPEYLAALKDPRITVSYSPERLGKTRAYNRVLPLTEDSELVFLISSDLSFPPSLFAEMADEFTDPTVGVVVPRIVPTNLSTMTTRIGKVLWDLHDIQLWRLSGTNENIHGGEIVAIRRELLSILPENTVNEDAWMCIDAIRRGYRVKYARGVVVHNNVPITLHDLLRQRRRINFGHRQLARSGRKPKLVTTMFLGDTGRAIGLISDLWNTYPEDAPYLPPLVVTEVAANLMAGLDVLDGREHSRWDMVKKEVPAPRG